MSNVSPLARARRALFESNLKSLEKLVMLALLEHWSRQGENFPSVGRLSRFTSLSERAVKSSLAGLERAGFVRVSRSNGKSNRYDLAPLFAMGRTSARGASVPVQEMPRSTGARETRVSGAPVHEVPPTSARGAPEPVHEVPPKRSIEEIQVRDPGHTPKQSSVLKAYYVELFKERKGCAPDWKDPTDHARVGKAFKNLSEAFEGDLVKQKQILRRALLDEYKQITDPHQIFRYRDELVGQEPRKKLTSGQSAAQPQRGTASNVQTGTLDDWSNEDSASHARAREEGRRAC